MSLITIASNESWEVNISKMGTTQIYSLTVFYVKLLQNSWGGERGGEGGGGGGGHESANLS